MPSCARPAQKVAEGIGHTIEAAFASSDRPLFPVRIRQVVGRGRGFFAARDIHEGEVVFQAAPLAWSISEDWMKNTCWWCFDHDARRGQSVKAMDASAQGGELATCKPPTCKTQAVQPAKKNSRQSPSRYKGVFCSLGCRQKAILAHGGQRKWDEYLAVLVGIEDEVRLYSSKTPRASKTHTEPDDNIAVLPVETCEKPCFGHCLDVDFDPDDMADSQLDEWISTVWDIIVKHQLFIDYQPNSSERELVRLIANQMHLEDALSVDQSCGDLAADWQTEVVVCSAANQDIAPLEALHHVKSNEAEVFRASMRELQASSGHLDDGSSAPATIAPIRLPWQPTPAQIHRSQWGCSFQAAAGSYLLLERAWRRAAKSSELGLPSHTRFRNIFYREKANSFGIWDPPADTSQSVVHLNGDPAEKTVSFDEREWVGFAVYPTAVYFNHS
ncbi:hypothetical protein GGI04_004265, partial [Coemansia thaxteri]